jgi:magnesium transporter
MLHTHQRPKVEEFDEYLFVILRAVNLMKNGSINNEQISFVLKSGVLVTFQERLGDGFDPVRRRLQERQGFAKRGGADYLAYTLIDAIIDNYFPVFEAYGDTMDQLEDRVRNNPTPDVSATIHQMRRELAPVSARGLAAARRDQPAGSQRERAAR